MQLRQQYDAHRESLKSVLGAPPDDAPLIPQTVQVEILEGYRREKVRYQVSPNQWAYAYVLIPEGTPPFPAIICHHRHNRDWSVGKSEVVGLKGDPNEAIGLELVKRGYAVLAPDAIAFEERCPKEIDHKDPLAAYENNFRELAVRLLRGETLLKKVIWDATRSIDYIMTRDEVDKKRVGYMGHGYGAKMAMWIASMDDRIAAGVAHGSVGSMHRALKLGHMIQFEFAVPRLLQVADYDRILTLIAPRPFLLSASKSDPDSMDVAEIYEKAERAYARMGASSRLTLYHYTPAENDAWFTIQARHRAFDWLDNWLKPY
jgi:dienelactone hydrolase